MDNQINTQINIAGNVFVAIQNLFADLTKNCSSGAHDLRLASDRYVAQAGQSPFCCCIIVFYFFIRFIVS